jgi:hypothetical protein
MEFELGEVLKDKVTGFQGVAMGRTEYFTDCSHYGLCSQSLKDGKPMEWEWFDETRLVRVEGAEKVVKEPRTPTSGPHPNAPQM